MNWTIARVELDGGAVEWQIRDAAGAQVGDGHPDHPDAFYALQELVQAELVLLETDTGAGEVTAGARFRLEFTEGEEARDNGGYARVIEPGSTLLDRPFPLPFMGSTETTWGHEGATLAGVLEDGGRTGDLIWLEGHFDTRPEAVEFERLVREGIMTRWSPDYGSTVFDFECTELDDDGWCIGGLDHQTEGVILGGTLVPFSAMDSAVITLLEDDPAAAEGAAAAVPPADDSIETPPPPEADDEDAPAALVAAGIPLAPPAAWFANPQFTEPTPLVIDASGQVYGHLAQWDTCHTGNQSACVCTPRSATGYSMFRTGYVVTAEGEEIPTGRLTLGGGHADTRLSYRAALDHYDNVATAVADLNCGEDEHGVWIAGALRPGVTEEQIRDMRASPPSGDWRPIGTGHELVLAHHVNQQGFTVPRTSVNASGHQLGLVAAGAGPLAVLAGRRPAAAKGGDGARFARLERELAETRAQLAALRPLEPLAREAARDRLVSASS